MKKLLLAVAFLCASDIVGWGWGNNGHDAIAYIAEQNLTRETRSILDRYLDGKSIVYYANWMDQMRRLPEYEGTLDGHSFAVDENYDARLSETPDSGNADCKDDGLYTYMKLIDSLSGGRYKMMQDEEVAKAIKILVHIVGDYHCPSHIRYAGVKSKTIIYNSKKVKYHTFWDTTMITRVHKWNYLEYGHALGHLTESQIEMVVKGGLLDWCEENAALCAPIHDWVADGAEFTNEMVYKKALPLADMMIQRAGYRLAKVLNEIFQ